VTNLPSPANNPTPNLMPPALPPTRRTRSSVLADRRVAFSLATIVVATLVLMALIGVVTFLPAQTITSTIQTQYTEQQNLLAGSLAREMENFFNGLANDLLDLSTRPSIQSISGLRNEALRILNELGAARQGQIKAIVRIARTGEPRYAYPESYNQRILDGTGLPWQIDAATADNIIDNRGVQLYRTSDDAGDGVYVLIMPLAAGLVINELIAFEVDVTGYFNNNFAALDLGKTGQLWVFDRNGSEIYSFRPEPEFSGGLAQFLNLTQTTLYDKYPTDDRLSIVSPVYTAFTQDRKGVGSLILILSRTINEAQEVVQGALAALFAFSLGLVAFVIMFGVLVGTYLIREGRRRQRAEARRSTANTLLDVARAMNSSLDQGIVLRRILDNLDAVMPHDNASILLYKEQGEGLEIAAETGMYFPDNQRKNLALTEVGAAKIVLDTNNSEIINDTLSDARWTQLPGSNIRAWLGVPLRVREQLVGVLNINSSEPNRFSRYDSEVAQAFADQAGVAIQNARAHELQIKAYEVELETARAIQNSLLPQESPPIPQVQLCVRSIPARQVSGDYHQYYTLPDGKLGLAIGDVSGKGIPAALLMAVITTALRDEVMRTTSPSDMMTELNIRLFPRMKQNRMNSALTLAVYDTETHLLELSSGGMNPPYVRNGKEWAEIDLSGYPLGAATRVSYNAKVIKLAAGSMLIFTTDGITEAQSPSRELFGFERLEALLNTLPAAATVDDVADAILGAVRLHLQGQDPQDDITIMVMKVLE
jgi:serine phosphatase RsbU (regulator of sigma subunit)